MRKSILLRRTTRSLSDFFLGFAFAGCFLVVIVLDADMAWPAQFDNSDRHGAVSGIMETLNEQGHVVGPAILMPQELGLLQHGDKVARFSGTPERVDLIYGEATVNFAVLPVALATNEANQSLVLMLIGVLFAGICTMTFVFFRHLRRVLVSPRPAHWGHL
jgi:hypothetical protein